MLVALAIGTASAAIVPFNGTESSWLHPDHKGEPTGDWLSQVNDTVPVRIGDAMQFQNRWYNNYAGMADLRISYGGGERYVCSGADEYIYYGLNFGNYYPSGTASVPLYATVSNCSEEPGHLVINHQYVYNGLRYGCSVAADPWTARFREATPDDLANRPTVVPEQQNNATAMPSSVATVRPTPTPGFGFDVVIALACLTAIACATMHFIRKGRG